MEIILNVKKTVDQNAQEYFEKAKKARKKLKGALEAIEKSKKKLLDAEKKAEEKISDLETREKEEKEKFDNQRKKEWYESLRWFKSSEGYLVVGGRDSTTNEIVIKKRTDKTDLVFHTDMAGSPFFVIKSGGTDVDLKKDAVQTIQETADATLCFSRAWKMGFSSTETFYVNPDQVTKDANPGEHLPKGAFMIRGKTNYLQPKLSLAIGMTKEGQIMCGPEPAIKVHCEKHVFLTNGGDEKPGAISKKIQKIIGGDLDDIIRALPGSGVKIKK
ncbi:DUF814 domain-containing protein [Candidatus Woesearchaeota archaeon]|jgi:predicted ribosome quality control (RQC) complex YloA/Tae2 family protein|nr:DUF814 domain-containing protein [Candidatus Woesearchaeota archaeon]